MILFKTNILEEDANTVKEIVKSGQIGFGPLVFEFENKFQKFSNKNFNIATNSASAAAYMIFAYLKEQYGVCDVYTPSLGFISPAWAAHHLGHNLIFVDVNDNLLFDIDHYDKIKKNTGRVKVLMPILYGGVSSIPNFDQIVDDEIVIVDSAHCVTPNIKCDYIFFSFHPFKPIASSDGGMISTDNENANTFFNLYRNFGRMPTGKTYDIISDGFKFYMNNLNAGIALTQLNRYDENLQIRKKCSKLLESKHLNGRMIPHDMNSSYYFNTLICDPNYVNILTKEFDTPTHYPLIHKSKLFFNTDVLSNTERLHPLILNLPLYDENIYNC